MSQRIAKIAPNFLVFLGSLFFLLFILEISARSFFGGSSQLPPGHHQLFCEYNSLLGWKKIPGAIGEHITSEYSISESMNSKGIRGPEYSYEKPDNEYRILVLGDSFAEGYTVEFNELFSEVLKAKLNNISGSDIFFEVINTGTGGYSTDQELLLFQTEGKRYNPDLTILMFSDNDVWFNNQVMIWRGYKPLFELDDNNTLKLTNVPVPKPDSGIEQYKRERKGSIDTIDTTKIWLNIKTWLTNNSYLYRFVRDRVKNTAYLHKLGIQLGLIEAKNEIIPIPAEFRVYEKQANDNVAEAWKITEALIVKLKEETASIDSEFLVFYNPVRQSVYHEEWNKMKKQYDMDDNSWSIEQVQSELGDICERNRVDCIEPIDAFRAKANDFLKKGQRLYFVEDGHWNLNGHKFAAEILEEHIINTYTIKMLNKKQN